METIVKRVGGQFAKQEQIRAKARCLVNIASNTIKLYLAKHSKILLYPDDEKSRILSLANGTE